MKTTTKILLGALASATLLAAGCVLPVKADGLQKVLTLGFDKGPVSAATITSPMARGAKLAYSVTERGQGEQKLRVIQAESDDEWAIGVDAVAQSAVILEALEVGSAEVYIEAESTHGYWLDNLFELSVAEVDSLDFANPCELGGEAAYFVDSDIRLHYTMRAGSEIAVGYGHYPVEFWPLSGAKLGEASTNGLLPLRTGVFPGRVEIRSTVSDDRFKIDLVEPRDVNALKLFEEDIYSSDKVPVLLDTLTSLHILPEVGDGLPVCQNNADMRVEVLTPNICNASFYQGPPRTEDLFHLYETQTLDVYGLNPGECTFRVTMPEAAGGQGVSVEKTVRIGGYAPDMLD
ncbi:hypothetical protein [Bradymonas sediminis]|uniref:Uncharacterized protein n=1 Tax=Bradymonas sediminis TaxID=1548548 RepID=A0A2Z4FQ12_9DELT|nr:hypothetical protein [Bradymonas sediminis]AWV90758.1 hypothetical protein DN745_16120 [Bradymonas sediminis]TDP62599.1 hypothetical protein DFR33_1122 [Bradymonas sediminis]